MLQSKPSTTPKPDQKNLRRELVLAAGLILLIVACRWGIDTPNFKPVMAVAMLAGFIFARPTLGIITVVSGMLISDALIGFYELPIALAVYGALALPLVAGSLMKRWSDNMFKLSASVLGFAGLSALSFYVITTLAIWGFTEWYPTTLAGLATAFAMGVPFLKWTLMGNVFFSITLFAGVAIANGLVVNPHTKSSLN